MDGKRVARVKIQRIRPAENERRTQESPETVCNGQGFEGLAGEP